MIYFIECIENIERIKTFNTFSYFIFIDKKLNNNMLSIKSIILLLLKIK